MAHKTLIGGTAYEISGGKTLVDGTAYSIKNGKTLVDGTAYEVGFGGLISFFIYGYDTGLNSNRVYQAESGMNWVEWCASSYNTFGIYVDGGYIRYNPRNGPVQLTLCNTDNYFDVPATDLIIDGYEYAFE